MSDSDPLKQSPNVDPSAFIAASADLIGAVTIGEEASIWYASVLRADINHIKIGARSIFRTVASFIWKAVRVPRLANT